MRRPLRLPASSGQSGASGARRDRNRTRVRYVAAVTDPLGDLARQLPAMLDLGQVQEATAVDALAEQASWRAGHLRETALRLQQDPDVTPRTLALLYQAADLVAARRRHRRHPL